MKESNKKKLLLCLIGFIIGLSGFIVSFVMYKKTNVKEEDKKEEVIADYVSEINDISFLNVSKSIHLGDVIPTLDKFGVNNDSITFTIKNNGQTDKDYTLSLKDDNSTILNKMIRYEISKNDEVIGIYTLSDNGIIDIGKIGVNEEIKYGIKLWLAYDSNVKVGTLKKKISVSDSNLVMDKSNANKPILVDGMIPVYYDYEKASFCKSDTNYSYYYEWYNYSNKKWANAVTVNSDKRDEYLKSPIGTKISMDDINAIWVWIPRFSYEEKDGVYSVTMVDKVLPVKDGFSFNNKEISGFWVSKFEAGLAKNDSCIKTSFTNECNKSNKTLYFKPGMDFTNRITMANLFYSIRNMEIKDNIYGFKNNGTKVNSDGTINKDSNNIDIHMIKNSEWDLVSILSLSGYGNKEINTNATNYSGMSSYEKDNYSFDVKEFGEKASTTGNITGVYDMVGGKCEYVMAKNIDNSLFSKKSDSGFTKEAKNYYYDSVKNDDKKLNYLINSGILSRGGYKYADNKILSICTINDYVDKISLKTNSRAVITIKEDNNG